MFIFKRNDFLFKMTVRWKTYFVYELHVMSRLLTVENSYWYKRIKLNDFFLKGTTNLPDFFV